MDWSEAITYIYDAVKLSTSEIAARTGVTNKYIHDLKSGKSKNPKTEFIKALVENLGVNPSWILTGKGPVLLLQIPHGAEFEASDPSVSVDEPQSSVPLGLSEFQNGISAGTRAALEAGPSEYELDGAHMEGARSLEMGGPAKGDDLVYVDFYAGQAIGAGPAQEVEVYQPVTPQAILRRFITPWRPDQVKALEARGDSMTKIGLFDRDIVLFVPSEREGDGVFVISIENRMQVKRLEFDLLGKTLRIISENDRYEPRVLTSEDEIGMVKIEGKVVGWLHRHPY